MFYNKTPVSESDYQKSNDIGSEKTVFRKNETFYRIAQIEQDMDLGHSNQVRLRSIAFAFLLLIYPFCLLAAADTRLLVSIFGVLIMCVLFGFDASIAVQLRNSEQAVYQLEVKELADKKKKAKREGETLPDAVLNRVIVPPDGKVSLPIVYYLVMIVLDLLINVF